MASAELRFTKLQQESGVGRQRSHNGPRVHTSAARYHDQEFLSVAARRDLWLQRCKGRVGTGGNADAFDCAAVIASLANDLRELDLANGRWRVLGARNHRTRCNGPNKERSQMPSDHRFLQRDERKYHAALADVYEQVSVCRRQIGGTGIKLR
jgi:hypothetical protein